MYSNLGAIFEDFIKIEEPETYFSESHTHHACKISGARNMYVISSKDNGEHFDRAQKLGTGDFMIDGCPMDGGDLSAYADTVVKAYRNRHQYAQLFQKPIDDTGLLGPSMVDGFI